MMLPVLNSGRGHAQRDPCFADSAERGDHLGDACHIESLYDFRIGGASAYMTFFVAQSGGGVQCGSMRTAADILAALRQKGVTDGDIAKALGIATPNANKLYNPAAKTGKTRKLTYDEAMLLIDRFDLKQEGQAADVEPQLVGVSLPVARLVVLYIATRFAPDLAAEDSRVEDLALDIQAFSALAAERPLRENVDRAEGFFQGRQSGLRGRGSALS